ncbi:MAG: hypothetical protein MHM6MM_000613 [Cercozoa sp. M6MM]
MVRIEYESANAAGKGVGYLEGESTKGVVVIQEWWGANQEIKDLATRWFPTDEFKTLVPDLYRGKEAIDHEEAGHLMDGLDWPGAIEDIRGAVRYLKNNGCTKVGIVGFCMGGALTLASSVLIDEADACSVFYGIPGAALADPAKQGVKCPLLLNFGDADSLEGFSSPADVGKLTQAMQEANVQFTLHTYPGCEHAFCRQEGPNYNAEQCAIAKARTLDFFNTHLN